MNITSYNITDVTYHYIGLRVLEELPKTSERVEQIAAVSANVREFVTNRALRLMLPAPGGTFRAAGEKICQELVHFQFAEPGRVGYQLTDSGRYVLGLLADQRFTKLRRLMAQVHMQTYDNLRSVVQNHIDQGSVWRPVVDAARISETSYVEKLLRPTFGAQSHAVATEVKSEYIGQPLGKMRDGLHSKVIKNLLPDQRMGVANFRGMCDRLVSLRLLNLRYDDMNGCKFIKTYSPCMAGNAQGDWHIPLEVQLSDGEKYRLLFCEPDMSGTATQDILLEAIDAAIPDLPALSGYHDIPDLRDVVCEKLLLPEAEFDNGLNLLLDRNPAPLSVGLHYDRITANRRPLVRTRQGTQLYNSIRRI